MSSPELRVRSDFDRYFERLVDSWIQRKRAEGRSFNHTVVVVTAGPYRPDAVTTQTVGNEIHLDFYSAIRNGFGALGESEIDRIINLL